jgi:protein TonB
VSRRFGLPLAASIAGHAAVVALLITLLGRLPSPVPILVPERAIVVTLAPPPVLQPPAPAKPPLPAPPKVEQPPPKADQLPPKAEQPPPKIEKPPPPPIAAKPRAPEAVQHREPPRPEKVERRQLPRAERAERLRTERIERAERRPERREYRREAPRALPRIERYAAPVAPAPYRSTPPIEYPVRPAAVPRRLEPPRPAAPAVSAAYRTELSAWLQSHKRYPESARMSGEQGQALLRFRVARSGRVLSYAIVRSSGYPALDAAVEAMMRGAVMPPFPADMSAPDIEVTVAVRFALGT